MQVNPPPPNEQDLHLGLGVKTMSSALTICSLRFARTSKMHLLCHQPRWGKGAYSANPDPLAVPFSKIPPRSLPLSNVGQLPKTTFWLRHCWYG